MDPDRIEQYQRILTDLAQKAAKGKLNMQDTFARSRVENLLQALRLGMKYFRYSGSVYEDTKTFCRARARKIFSIEEMLEWGNASDRPKVVDYDPVVHLGGNCCCEGEEHCNHGIMFIDDQSARRYRPDIPAEVPQHVSTWSELLEKMPESERSKVVQFRERAMSGKVGLEAVAIDAAIRVIVEKLIAGEVTGKDGKRVDFDFALAEVEKVLAKRKPI